MRWRGLRGSRAAAWRTALRVAGHLSEGELIAQQREFGGFFSTLRISTRSAADPQRAPIRPSRSAIHSGDRVKTTSQLLKPHCVAADGGGSLAAEVMVDLIARLRIRASEPFCGRSSCWRSAEDLCGNDKASLRALGEAGNRQRRVTSALSSTRARWSWTIER